MRRFIMLFVLLGSLLIVALPSLSAQDTNTAPLYVRYCELDNIELLTNSISGAETQLATLEDMLTRFDDGFITYLEGVSLADEGLTSWRNIQKIDCLTPLYADVEKALSELLIAMLYGQINDLSRSGTHLQTARDTIVVIRASSQEAITYLQNPVPVVEEPVATEEPITDSTQPRTAEELGGLMQTYLLDNGITLLRESRIELLPEGATITVTIDALPEFDDYLNVIFTMDILSEGIRDWQERSQLNRIIVEVYSDDVTRILYVESSYSNFAAYYYDQTLTKEQFEAALTRFGEE